MRLGYVAVNLAENALAPVTAWIKGPQPLGIDGNPDRVHHILNWLSPALKATEVRIEGNDVLELGPGRTLDLLSAFVLAGAKTALGLDIVLERNPRPANLRSLAQMLRAGQLPFLDAIGGSPEIVGEVLDQLERSDNSSVRLRRYGGTLLPLGDETVDLLFSRSVLEHVRSASVRTLVGEMRRVLKPTGAMIHMVDLRDHMVLRDSPTWSGPSFSTISGDWLDALTYPEWLYDAMFSRRSAYINRLRADQWLRLFEDAGFRVAYRSDQVLEPPPSVRFGRLREPWRSTDPEILCIAETTLGLRPRS
jgi:SAM-dependent methyltransferase